MEKTCESFVKGFQFFFPALYSAEQEDYNERKGMLL